MCSTFSFHFAAISLSLSCLSFRFLIFVTVFRYRVFADASIKMDSVKKFNSPINIVMKAFNQELNEKLVLTNLQSIKRQSDRKITSTTHRTEYSIYLFGTSPHLDIMNSHWTVHWNHIYLYFYFYLFAENETKQKSKIKGDPVK